jgi:hypothetical protein
MDNYIQFQWEKLQKDVGFSNCYLLMDDTHHPEPIHSIYSRWNHIVPHCPIIYINYEECCQVNKLHSSNKEQVESQLYILSKCIQQDYDYLYLIEYDVFCDGNWKTTLDKNNSLTDDFLATHVENYNSYNMLRWGHWFHLKGPKRFKPKRQDRVKSFFPITRYSKKGIQLLQSKIGIYTGFCEIYIPSLFKQNQFTYNNIETICIGKHWIFTEEDKSLFKPLLYNDNKLLHPINQILN